MALHDNIPTPHALYDTLADSTSVTGAMARRNFVGCTQSCTCMYMHVVHDVHVCCDVMHGLSQTDHEPSLRLCACG